MAAPNLLSIKQETMDDEEITFLPSETKSERHWHKKKKSKRQREQMLSCIISHLEKWPFKAALIDKPPRIKPPPNFSNRTTTIIPTCLPQNPNLVITSTSRTVTLSNVTYMCGQPETQTHWPCAWIPGWLVYCSMSWKAACHWRLLSLYQSARLAQTQPKVRLHQHQGLNWW